MINIYQDSVFLTSLILVFTSLLAIGPISMTIINTVVINGLVLGIYASLGAFCADVIFIPSAAFMLDRVANFLIHSKYVYFLSIIGCLILFYLAFSFWNTKIQDTKEVNIKKQSKIKTFLTLFIITITGPTTILSYAAVFANFVGKKFNKLEVIFGGLLGSFLFHALLVAIVYIVRKKLTTKLIMILNKTASITIFLFALYVVVVSVRGIDIS